MPQEPKPLTRQTRRVYLWSFVVLFILCLPAAILYATGYRLQDGFSLIETGGVFISVAPSGAVVSLNGKVIGTSGFLDHTFYIDNLEPGTYAVHVAHEGSYPWYKTLTVEPQIVTDARAFLVPSEIVVRKLVVATSTGTTTLRVTRDELDTYASAFVASTSKKVATSTVNQKPAPADTLAGQELYLDETTVRLEWSRSTTSIPSSLCSTPSVCSKSVVIARAKEKILRANFFQGGVLYQSPASGIYLTEIDVRPSPLNVPIYTRPGADYRLIQGRLIVKDGASLYEISGF